MKKIELLVGRNKVPSGVFATVSDEDYERISKNEWFLMKFYHCETDINYARRYESIGNKKQKHIMMHREILGIEDTKDVCDHIDHNGLNNVRENLRVCSHAENMSYRRKLTSKYRNNYKGVHLDKDAKTWFFNFFHNKISYRQSGFETELDCVLAYNKELVRVKGEFACINDIQYATTTT